MLVINQNEVTELLSMDACIEAMEAVLADLSAGRAVQSLRHVLPLAEPNLLGLMPGYLSGRDTAGAKLISVFPANHGRGLPSHQGLIALFDAGSGAVKAVVDGRQITAIRTAAVSAAATRKLAVQGAETLALLGTGEQARTHLCAMLLVRPVNRVLIWSRTASHALAFQREMSRETGIPIEVAESPEAAVRRADIVCTVTASTEPVLRGEWLKPGAHINAVGACRAPDRELDTAATAMSRLYVDRLESALHEAGDYLIPLAEGAIGRSHIVGEIGELFGGHIEGRRTDGEITLFKALGLAVEDLAAADLIYNEAVRLKRGIDIPW